MEKITIDRVCKKVYDRNWREIDPAMESGTAGLPYSYREFEGDVMAGDFISSRITAKNKWTALKAMGVVTESGKTAVLRLDALKEACGKWWDA